MGGPRQAEGGGGDRAHQHGQEEASDELPVVRGEGGRDRVRGGEGGRGRGEGGQREGRRRDEGGRGRERQG